MCVCACMCSTVAAGVNTQIECEPRKPRRSTHLKVVTLSFSLGSRSLGPAILPGRPPPPLAVLAVPVADQSPARSMNSLSLKGMFLRAGNRRLVLLTRPNISLEAVCALNLFSASRLSSGLNVLGLSTPFLRSIMELGS